MKSETQDNEVTNGETPQGLDRSQEDTSRDEVLEMLDDAMAEAHRKIESGRVYDPQNEKTRQGWLRTLGYLAGQYRQLKKDKDLEELEERLEELERERGVKQ